MDQGSALLLALAIVIVLAIVADLETLGLAAGIISREERESYGVEDSKPVGRRPL